MVYLALKAILTGAVVVTISEIAKRSSFIAALVASLPLTSIFALIWLYQDEKNLDATKNLAIGIFWMVLPSLIFFLAFPFLVRQGFKFYPALLFSSFMTSAFYWIYVQILTRMGFRF